MVFIGGMYEGLELQCMCIYVKFNMGGMVEVVVYKWFDVSVNIGGSIDYSGELEIKNVWFFIFGGIWKL